MQISYKKAMRYDSKYIIALPDTSLRYSRVARASTSDETKLVMLENKLIWFKIPDDIYDHKEYPLCTCGKRYVRTSKNETECFSCMLKRT